LHNKKNKIIIKILCFSKQEKLLEEHEEKMIRASLNSLDKLNKLETREQKKYKEKTRRDTQLFVFSSRILAPTNGPLIYYLVDFLNPFNNPSFVVSLANYDFLDFF
jgi:hypothetical protein